ncbi:RimK family alpha-L-glutamate ligase [Haloferax namakaokahaiae]|uniref:RimK family alpha-L-glutamate ligase n=1 Tax=Haloferax namakaokahaiae TaxID=1748331 RepID=A0ABD5ZDA7_9EURY
MTTIALATGAEFPTLIDDDDSFVAALEAHGVTVEPAVWSDESVEWNEFDAIVIRSTWGYYEHAEAFVAWIDSLKSVSTPVWNHPEMLRWNTHKFYLRDLADRGVSTLPTEYVEQNEGVSLESVFEERDWDELIVKPAVSAGAFETKRITHDEHESEQSWVDSLNQSHDLLIQEFAREITGGEWSIIFFGDDYSHSVVKRPKEGDFRVQDDYGGSVHVEEPSESLREQAREVLDAVEAETAERPLYARIDGVERDSDFCLLEAELIEPELFFRVDSEAGERFAGEILDAL